MGDTKKWAYCKRDGRLVFNWQLIALPRELADYVVLHEVTHLSEFSHSNRFKRKLALICPDFREKEAMLKRYIAEFHWPKALIEFSSSRGQPAPQTGSSGQSSQFSGA